jgi:hypothetical protein
MSAGTGLSHRSHSVLSEPVNSGNAFSERVSRLLQRIDCRRADSAEEREAIFRLRYQAYLREQAILPNAAKLFTDPYDDTDNVYLFGLYLDGELASSIRIHVGSRERPYFPSLEVFRDVLEPKLDAGKVIIDATRLVSDERLSRLYHALPYATVRINWLAAAYFENGYSLAAVRPEHRPFYRRTFRLRLICETRDYPYLIKPLCLMANDYPSVADYVHQRYPFFRSTLAERRKLFERTPAAPDRQSSKLQNDNGPLDDCATPLLAGDAGLLACARYGTVS